MPEIAVDIQRAEVTVELDPGAVATAIVTRAIATSEAMQDHRLRDAAHAADPNAHLAEFAQQQTQSTLAARFFGG